MKFYYFLTTLIEVQPPTALLNSEIKKSKKNTPMVKRRKE